MIRLDQTGFPLVKCTGPRLWVGLLPVTRVQFEYFLGDRTGFDPAAYEAITRTSPRASWRSIPAERPEDVFLTGVLPEEAARFAAWLGGGARLPTLSEWRAIDAALHALNTQTDDLTQVLDCPELHPAARAVMVWLHEQRERRWRPLTLLEDGLLEWVHTPTDGYGLQGRPRRAVFPVIHNPQAHEPIRPRPGSRHRAFGVRVVCPA